MTLLVTAISTDVVVLGADSASTWDQGGELITLMGFPKIISVPRLSLGISIAGTLKIGPESTKDWLPDWLDQFANDMSEAKNFQEFGIELKETLSAVAEDDQQPVVHIANWAKSPKTGHTVPNVGRVRRIDGEFEFEYFFGQEDKELYVFETAAAKPISIVTDGIPSDYGNWIRDVGAPAFSKLMGSTVPRNEASHIVAYVRFLIRLVAELHVLTGAPRVVAEPIQHLVILPNKVNMFGDAH